MTGQSAPGTRRPGGRTARVREAALTATLELLADKGFDGLSVDGVATRSGVHRATLHRRWGDVGGLLANALDSSTGEEWTPPDTGSLADDLAAITEEVREALVAPRSVTAAVVAASFRSEPAAAAMRRFLADRYERAAVVVHRAVTRGEVPEGTDPGTVLLAATGPVYHQVLLLGDPPDATTARRYAELAAAGATRRPGPWSAVESGSGSSSAAIRTRLPIMVTGRPGIGRDPPTSAAAWDHHLPTGPAHSPRL